MKMNDFEGNGFKELCHCDQEPKYRKTGVRFKKFLRNASLGLNNPFLRKGTRYMQASSHYKASCQDTKVDPDTIVSAENYNYTVSFFNILKCVLNARKYFFFR